MIKGGGEHVSDDQWLELLRGSLNQSAQNLLWTRLEADPNLTYSTFWKELEGIYDRDPLVHSRRDWERVTLGGEQHPSIERWEEFVTEFEMKLAGVREVTEWEKQQKFREEIPDELRRELAREEARWAREQFWVQIPEPLPMPMANLEELVAQLTGRVHSKGEQVMGVVLFDCGSR